MQLAHCQGLERVPMANDMQLLQCNGGSLTPDEWRHPNYRYEPKRGIVTLPIRRLYLLTKNGQR